MQLRNESSIQHVRTRITSKFLSKSQTITVETKQTFSLAAVRKRRNIWEQIKITRLHEETDLYVRAYCFLEENHGNRTKETAGSTTKHITSRDMHHLTNRLKMKGAARYVRAHRAYILA
jgi:hypothetical protein